MKRKYSSPLSVSDKIIEEYIKALSDKAIKDKYTHVANKFNVQRKDVKWFVFGLNYTNTCEVKND